MLSPRQTLVFKYLNQYQSDNSIMPTVKQASSDTNIDPVSIRFIMIELVKKGYAEKLPRGTMYYKLKGGFMKPEDLARSGTEDGHQLALLCWCQQNQSVYPDLRWLFHIPNGGSRHKAEAGKLKAMGVRPGVPDLFLPIKRWKYSGLWIELKRPTTVGKAAGVASGVQVEWLNELEKQGFRVKICFGWESARDQLMEYLNYESQTIPSKID